VIRRYSDHTANERTFLAWIRTAIAVMAFGFLVEKFDFFLEVAARTLPTRAPSDTGRLVGDFSGFPLLIVLGGSMMFIATLRFLQTTKDIDADEPRPAKGKRLDVAVVLLLIGLGGTLFAYLVYTLLRRMGGRLIGRQRPVGNARPRSRPARSRTFRTGGRVPGYCAESWGLPPRRLFTEADTALGRDTFARPTAKLLLPISLVAAKGGRLTGNATWRPAHTRRDSAARRGEGRPVVASVHRTADFRSRRSPVRAAVAGIWFRQLELACKPSSLLRKGTPNVAARETDTSHGACRRSRDRTYGRTYCGARG